MMDAFSVRMDRYQDELKWLFFEFYPNDCKGFDELLLLLRERYQSRSAEGKERDSLLLNNPEWYKKADMSSFLLPNGKIAEVRLSVKANPKGAKSSPETEGMKPSPETEGAKPQTSPETKGWLLKKAAEFLSKTEAGAMIVKLAGAEDLFRVSGTDWQNENRVHHLLRIFRIINDIVCPGVLLLCGSGYAGVKNCFGSTEKPECHLGEDAEMVPTFWQTIATQDVRLLDHVVNRRAGEAKRCTYLRDADQPFSWALDFEFLEVLKMSRESHLLFLNRFFAGGYENGNAEWKTKVGSDGKIILKAKGKESKKLEALFTAFLKIQSGILLGVPDYEKNGAFDADADVWTVQTDNKAVLGMGRYKNGQKIYGFYNFSPDNQIFSFRDSGRYFNVLTGKASEINHLAKLPGYGFAWLREKD